MMKRDTNGNLLNGNTLETLEQDTSKERTARSIRASDALSLFSGEGGDDSVDIRDNFSLYGEDDGHWLSDEEPIAKSDYPGTIN